jgi:hypothetical protein
MKQFIYHVIPVLLLSSLLSQVFAETKSTSNDQNNLSLTVYNGGRALVKDSRNITLPTDTKRLAFMDVAEKIMPQTVAIEGLDVLEQNYDFDLLSPQSLVNKNIGKNVRIARRSKETGETIEWIDGKILSTNGGIILQMQDGSLETLNPNTNYHMIFNEVPGNLRTTPTLSLLLNQPTEGIKQVELTYLTTGLSWQSDYVMQLNKQQNRATLDSWITLKNFSGISYHNTNLQLLAGDVNMQRPSVMRTMMAESDNFQRKAMAPVTEQALHGYHLYSVPHKTTINNNQSKQIKLFARNNIPVQKILQDQAYVNSRGLNTQKSKPDQILVFKNAKPDLGLPLPKGTIRVYGKDNSGHKQFIGEDNIDHTAISEELEIKLGKAFDISIERSTKDHRQLSKKQIQLKRKIKINNGGEEQQTLAITEIMPSQSWMIKKPSHAYLKISPTMAEFKLTIPALTEQTIVYDVVVTYP